MRRLLSALLGSLAVGLSALVLAADSPHFISEGTASITSSGAYHVANFKEAGLGNTATTEAITLSATATATYALSTAAATTPRPRTSSP